MFKINTCILYLSLSVLFLNFISQTCFIKYKNILILKDRYFLGNVCSLSSMKTQTNQCTWSFPFVVTCKWWSCLSLVLHITKV